METIKDISLSLVCPICGARKQERCQLFAGGFRAESHRQRIEAAIEMAAQSAKPNNAAPLWPQRAGRCFSQGYLP